MHGATQVQFFHLTIFKLIKTINIFLYLLQHFVCFCNILHADLVKVIRQTLIILLIYSLSWINWRDLNIGILVCTVYLPCDDAHVSVLMWWHYLLTITDVPTTSDGWRLSPDLAICFDQLHDVTTKIQSTFETVVCTLFIKPSATLQNPHIM